MALPAGATLARWCPHVGLVLDSSKRATDVAYIYFLRLTEVWQRYARSGGTRAVHTTSAGRVAFGVIRTSHGHSAAGMSKAAIFDSFVDTSSWCRGRVFSTVTPACGFAATSLPTRAGARVNLLFLARASRHGRVLQWTIRRRADQRENGPLLTLRVAMDTYLRMETYVCGKPLMRDSCFSSVRCCVDAITEAHAATCAQHESGRIALCERASRAGRVPTPVFSFYLTKVTHAHGR